MKDRARASEVILFLALPRRWFFVVFIEEDNFLSFNTGEQSWRES